MSVEGQTVGVRAQVPLAEPRVPGGGLEAESWAVMTIRGGGGGCDLAQARTMGTGRIISDRRRETRPSRLGGGKLTMPDTRVCVCGMAGGGGCNWEMEAPSLLLLGAWSPNFCR